MTPLFLLSVEGEDITALAQSRLLSLTLTDGKSNQSDQCEIVLDDREPRIAVPRKGARISVALPYLGALVPMPSYVVDEVGLDGPPDRMTIQARGANLAGTNGGASMRQPRTRSWHLATLGQIILQIGTEAGIPAQVDPQLGATPVAHLDQVRETDFQLLARLADHYDAHIAVHAGTLVAVAQHSLLAVSGAALPIVTISPKQVSRWSASEIARHDYSGARAQWYDVKTGQVMTVSAGSPAGAQLTLSHQYADPVEAAQAARASLARAKRGTGELELSLVLGDPRITTGTHILTVGFRDGLNGKWVAKETTHRLSGAGFATELRAEATA